MKGLGLRAKQAVAWNVGFTVVRDVVQFAVALILARLLTPDAYGQFGLVVSIMGFLNVLSSQSFVSHALQVRDQAEVRYQDHFTLGGAIQGTLFLLTNLIALILLLVPRFAPTAPLLFVMSITFLLDWPGALRATMLERNLDWRRLRSLHGTGLVAASALSIVLAIIGAGVWALLIPGLLFKRLPFIYDLFISARWRPTWRFDSLEYRPAWRFGLNRLTSGAIVNGRRLLESGVLVHALGFAAFGLYGRAVGLAQIGCHQFTAILMQSIYPVLTKIEPGTSRYCRASSVLLRSVTWTVVPVAVLLTTLADPVVRLAYGRGWLEVIPLVPWAGAAIAASAIGHAAYTLLLANQCQRHCLIADAGALIGVGACLFWLAPGGLIVYLQGLLLVHGIITALMLGSMYTAGILTVRGLRPVIVTPVLACALGLISAEMVTRAAGLRSEGIAGLLLFGGVFILVYGFGLRALGTSDFAEVVRQVPIDNWLRRTVPTEL